MLQGSMGAGVRYSYWKEKRWDQSPPKKKDLKVSDTRQELLREVPDKLKILSAPPHAMVQKQVSYRKSSTFISQNTISKPG